MKISFASRGLFLSTLSLSITYAFSAHAGMGPQLLGATNYTIADFPVIGTVSFGLLPSNLALTRNLGACAVTGAKDIAIFNTQTGLLQSAFKSSGTTPTGIALYGTLGAVTNATSKDITLFDASNQTIISTIKLANEPRGVGLEGNIGIVANFGSNYVNLFNTSSAQLTGTIVTGSAPIGVAVENGIAAVANSGSNNVTILDIKTGSILRTISVGTSPFGIALNGTIGAVANLGSNNVTIFNPITGATITSVPAGNKPDGVALRGVFGAVANRDSNNITIFETSNFSVIGTISVGQLPNSVKINGTIGYVSNFLSNNVTLFNLPGFSVSGGGNSAVTAETLNAINNKCPSSTQQIIDALFYFSEPQQAIALNELSPSFKIVQYGQEKLDLLLQKELESSLYIKDTGTRAQILTGYDHLHQFHNKTYNGYKINNFYQLLVVSHGWKQNRVIAGIGAAESYLHLNHSIGRANYPTVYGTLGYKRDRNRWQFGLTGLFGYSFIDAKRTIAFLNDKAETNHGAWTASLDAKFSYSFVWNYHSITPYDDISYVYGSENSYTEHGAPGANFHVKDEKISVIRNVLGIKLEMPTDLKTRVFIDGAWLYENYLNDQGYYAAFAGTSVYGKYYQRIPTKNYGRLEAGLLGTYDKFDWKLSYLGLFGHDYLENSINAKIGYKF